MGGRQPAEGRANAGWWKGGLVLGILDSILPRRNSSCLNHRCSWSIQHWARQLKAEFPGRIESRRRVLGPRNPRFGLDLTMQHGLDATREELGNTPKEGRSESCKPNCRHSCHLQSHLVDLRGPRRATTIVI